MFSFFFSLHFFLLLHVCVNKWVWVIFFRNVVHERWSTPQPCILSLLAQRRKVLLVIELGRRLGTRSRAASTLAGSARSRTSRPTATSLLAANSRALPSPLLLWTTLLDCAHVLLGRGSGRVKALGQRWVIAIWKKQINYQKIYAVCYKKRVI